MGLVTSKHVLDESDFDSGEPSSTFSLAELPDEIILYIFSYLDAKALLEVSGLNRSLRMIASDEVLWRPLYKQHWGSCRLLDNSSFKWKEEFIKRKDFVTQRRTQRDTGDEGREQLQHTFWERVASGLSLFKTKHKRKIVFVGLEAAGKVSATKINLICSLPLTVPPFYTDYLLLQAQVQRTWPKLCTITE